MFKDYKILLLLALVGFVLVGISVKDSFDQDYVKHQKDYYKRIGEKEYCEDRHGFQNLADQGA